MQDQQQQTAEAIPLDREDADLMESLTAEESSAMEAYRTGAESAPQRQEPVAEQPQEGEADDEDPEVLEGQNKGQFVRHGAFHKERERRKAAEGEVTTLRERMARAEERMAVLNDVLTLSGPQQQEQPKEPDDPRPNPEEDIFAYVQWQERQRERDRQEIQRLVEQQTQQTQQMRQAQELSAVQERYKADAMAYVKQQPDFADAYGHLRQSYAEELAARGLDEASINQVLLQEEFQVASQSIQAGRNPAEVLYNMARARGYQPKQAASAMQQANPAADKIASIKQAQSQAVTLNGSGGTSGEGLTLASLADMSDEQFQATLARVGKSKINQLLGG